MKQTRKKNKKNKDNNVHFILESIVYNQLYKLCQIPLNLEPFYGKSQHFEFPKITVIFLNKIPKYPFYRDGHVKIFAVSESSTFCSFSKPMFLFLNKIPNTDSTYCNNV